MMIDFDPNRLKTFAAMLTLLGLIVPAIVAYLRSAQATAKAIGWIVWIVCAVGAVAVIVADFAMFGDVPGSPAEFVPYAVGVLIALVTIQQIFYRTFYKTIAADLTHDLENTGPKIGG